MGPTARPAWEWVLLALCLWGALQVGAALVLKGNRVEGEVFAFDALRCENSRAHRPCPLLGAPVLRQGANQNGQRDNNQGPSGGAQRPAAGTGNSLPRDRLQEEAINDKGGVRGLRAQ